MTDAFELLAPAVDIARRAGAEIMAVYNDDPAGAVTLKADNSPLTEADTRSNRYIMQALSNLTPIIPIVSEESLDEAPDRLQARELWMVDPLDGTKDFLKRNDEFTVNIALIREGKPVLGVVYAPALDLTYWGAEGHGAWKQEHGKRPARIEAGEHDGLPVITVSRSHLDEATQAWLDAFGPHELLPAGSSLKFCYVAEGRADVYPRLGPIMEWDIAAADAVLRAAGAQIVQQSDGKEPVYNKADLHQPTFVAYAPGHQKVAAPAKR